MATIIGSDGNSYSLFNSKIYTEKGWKPAGAQIYKENLTEELSTQDSLITQIQETLRYKAAGGTEKPFAIIGVTYPEDSTCTCSKDETIFTLENTNGKDFFSIPEAGTWTVTATDGINSKSQSVSITTEGQLESVVLNYRYYLFDNGSIVPFGVYDKNDNANASTASVGTTIKGTTKSVNGYTGWCVGTEDAISLVGYDKIGINVSAYTTTKSLYFGICNSVWDLDDDTPSVRDGDLAAYQSIEATGEIYLDISSLNTDSRQIVVVRDWWTYGTGGEVEISQIWLE